MYGGCRTNESTASHCALIHFNYMESCLCESESVHLWFKERTKYDEHFSVWKIGFVCLLCIWIQITLLFLSAHFRVWTEMIETLGARTEIILIIQKQRNNFVNKGFSCTSTGSFLSYCVSNFKWFRLGLIKEHFTFSGKILRAVHWQQTKCSHPGAISIPCSEEGSINV